MVRRVFLLACLLGCAPREGTVLIARDAAAPLDAELTTPVVDAALELDAEMSEAASPAPTDAATQEASVADATLAQLPGMCRISGAQSGFYETFDGSALSDTWLLAHGRHSFAGRQPRGGFVRDNVAVQGGTLVLSIRGDRYAGPVRGFSADGSRASDGRRTAAAIVTRDLFASGTYQMEGRFVTPPGVEVAMWVMADDDRSGGIDVATPAATLPDGGVDARTVRMRARTGRDNTQVSENTFVLASSLADDNVHNLRFDWYTVTTPSTQFWVDDDARWSTSTHVPTGTTRRLWIVAWVPDDAPADFETAEIRIDNAFITPFGNNGDRCVAAEFRSPGLLAPR